MDIKLKIIPTIDNKYFISCNGFYNSYISIEFISRKIDMNINKLVDIIINTYNGYSESFLVSQGIYFNNIEDCKMCIEWLESILLLYKLNNSK